MLDKFSTEVFCEGFGVVGIIKKKKKIYIYKTVDGVGVLVSVLECWRLCWCVGEYVGVLESMLVSMLECS